MPKLVFTFEKGELEIVEELTSYNNIVYKVKNSKFNFDHVHEEITNGGDNISHEFGIIKDGKFKSLFQGEGSSLSEIENKFRCVDIYVDTYYDKLSIVKLENIGE